MPELPRGIKEFLGRDLFYAVGGAFVLVALLYRFDRLPTEGTPSAYYVFGMAVAFILGQAITGVAQVIRLVTTDWVERPWRVLIRIYHHMNRGKWQPLERPLDRTALRNALQARWAAGPEYLRDFWERRSRSLIMWAVVSPCSLVSGILLLWRAKLSRSEFDYVLAVGSLTVFVAALVENWVCAIHCTRLDYQTLIESEVVTVSTADRNAG